MNLAHFIAFVAALFVLVNDAAALSCPPPVPMERKIAEAKSIFVGQVQVVNLIAEKNAIEATLSVVELLKGELAQAPPMRASIADYEKVYSGGVSTLGDAAILVGHRYLVFVSGDGPVEYHPCSRTRWLRRSQDHDLAAIRKLMSLDTGSSLPK
jgi:hypothetical protein